MLILIYGHLNTMQQLRIRPAYFIKIKNSMESRHFKILHFYFIFQNDFIDDWAKTSEPRRILFFMGL